MKRWTMWLMVALLVAAVPVARLAVAQDQPGAPGTPPLGPAEGDDGDWLALDAGPAMAEGHGMGHAAGWLGRGRHWRAVAKELDLTDDQQKKIEAVHDTHRRKAIAMRADLEVAQLDLHKLMRAEPLDRKAIDAQLDRTIAMRGQLHKARMGALLDARAVLTPEQREKLQDVRAAHPRMRGTGRRAPGRGAEGSDM